MLVIIARISGRYVKVIGRNIRFHHLRVLAGVTNVGIEVIGAINGGTVTCLRTRCPRKFPIVVRHSVRTWALWDQIRNVRLHTGYFGVTHECTSLHIGTLVHRVRSPGGVRHNGRLVWDIANHLEVNSIRVLMGQGNNSQFTLDRRFNF